MTRISIFVCLFFLSLAVVGFAQTILYPGDLALVGLASNVGGDLGNCTPDGNGQFQGRDRVSFVCFVDIEPGTVIDITDNGWERGTAGFWGNTEGFIQAIRTGALIPAGTVITFEFPPVQTNSIATAPDGDWDFQILGTNALNFNDSGDQLYFLQGGAWDNGTTIGCCNGNQNAQYLGGRILFGFNSTSTWNAFSNDSQSSGLHPEVIPCFNMAPTNGVTSFTSYSGPITSATQLDWIARIGNPANWTTYTNCMAYQNPPETFSILPSGMFIDCRVCRACGPITDTLIFALPLAGGPFMVEYTDGQDTFLLDDLENADEAAVFITNSTSYRLLKVTDSKGCPVYSNFVSGADIQVQSTTLNINCIVKAPAPGGRAEITISDGVPPYTLTWMIESGAGGMETSGLSGVFLLNNLQNAGTYQVTVTDAGGCEGDCTFVINELDCSNRLSLDLGTDVNLKRGQEAFVVGSVNFLPTRIFWDPQDGVADPTALVTSVSPDTTTIYTVTAFDGDGCFVNDQIMVTVTRDHQVFMPNVFSPNQDGINDVFTLYPGPEITGIQSLLIFDRWGNMVFDGRNQLIDATSGWDGRLLNGQEAAAGVYLFWAVVMDSNGQETIVKGSVGLLR